jgi:hypothetical protein
LADQLSALKTQVDTLTITAQAAIAQSHQKTQQQQKTDAQLPLPDLANRWALLLSLQPENFTATSDNKIVVSNNAAHSTVSELEKIPDLTLTITQTNAELAGCNQVRTKQDETITGLNKQLTDEQAARKADVKEAKTAQRKSWIKGFKWGFVGGFVSGLFVGHQI